MVAGILGGAAPMRDAAGRWLASCGTTLALAISLDAHAFEAVAAPQIPAVVLQWQAAPVAGRRPVVVALHGCGGLYTRGAIDQRYVEYAARWNAAGWHVLLPDSFSARGRTSICREPGSERSVTVATRRDDVNAVLAWLGQRPDVDPGRIALVGWSNGGSTVLRAVDRPGWSLAPAVAVAFYPSCAAASKRSEWDAAMPLLILAGALDDWTPPHYCTAVGQRAAERPRRASIEVITYPDSHHGFDGHGPVRRLDNIPGGAGGTGVHVGGSPAARADALRRTDHFLHRFLD